MNEVSRPGCSSADLAPAIRWLVVAAAFALVNLAAPRPAAAEFNPVSFEMIRQPADRSQTISLPDGGKPTRGVRVFVTLPSFRTPDTMRVVTRVETTGAAATADRTFTVRLIPVDHALPSSTVVATFDVTLPQNARQVESITYVPKASYGNSYAVEIAEDGQVADGFRGLTPLAVAVNSESSEQLIREESTPRLLLLTDSWLPEEEAIMADLIGNHQTFLTPNLAEDWRAYEPYDLVVVELERWEALPADVQTEVMRWVRCGGNLMLTAANLDQRPMFNDSTSLKFQYAALHQSWHSSDVNRVIIRDPLGDRYSQANQPMPLYQWFDQYNVGSGGYLSSMIPNAADLRAASSSLWTRMIEQSGPLEDRGDPMTVRAVGGGRVFRTVQSIQRPAGLLLDIAVTQVHQPWRSRRLMRRGVDPVMGSQRFAAWLIPGLGQPPVYSFIALLTLFTLAVGPFAYYKTSKANRTYLMFLIAPVLAIVTTTAMLVYGVVADGFSTHARIRQVTWVDSETGDAATRNRSTYFAGIRPADGLTFDQPKTITLLPDSDGRTWWERMSDRPGGDRTIRVSENSLQFGTNFLPSRQQRQFVTTRPRDQFGGLELVVADRRGKDDEANAEASSALPQVRNTMPVKLIEAILCGSDGSLHRGQNVGPNELTSTISLTQKEAGELLGDLYISEWLVSTRVGQSRRPSGRASYRVTDIASSVSFEFDDPTKPLEGLFEYELQYRMQLSSQLMPGTFVAVAELTEDAIAIDDATPTDSIHFLFGSITEKTP